MARVICCHVQWPLLDFRGSLLSLHSSFTTYLVKNTPFGGLWKCNLHCSLKKLIWSTCMTHWYALMKDVSGPQYDLHLAIAWWMGSLVMFPFWAVPRACKPTCRRATLRSWSRPARVAKFLVDWHLPAACRRLSLESTRSTWKAWSSVETSMMVLTASIWAPYKNVAQAFQSLSSSFGTHGRSFIKATPEINEHINCQSSLSPQCACQVTWHTYLWASALSCVNN